MKTVNLVLAYHIDIFCKMNDWSDIKCGGSPTLGYDFYVNGKKNISENEIKSMIEKLLNKYKRYYQTVSIRKIKDYREDQLWSEDDIEKCIKKTDCKGRITFFSPNNY